MSLDAVGIVTDDVDATLRFFSVLGVAFEAISPQHHEGTTKHGTRIMIDATDMARSLHTSTDQPFARDAHGGHVNTSVVLCFVQDTPADVDRVYNELVGGGAPSVRAPWDAFWGQRYASVRDPSGNQIDIFAPNK